MIAAIGSAILYFFGILFLLLFIYSITKQKSSLSESFAAMCLAMSVYLIGYGLELQSNSIEEIKFFLKLEYFGISFIPTLWFFVSYKYYFKRKIPIYYVAPLMTFSILTLFFQVTNDYHHLIYKSLNAVMVSDVGYLLAVSEKGIWYIVHVALFYCIILFGVYVYFMEWKREHFALKSNSFIMLMSPLVPSGVLLIYLFQKDTIMPDLTPFGLIASALLICVALFHYDFLELQQMIKDIAFLEIGEGIMVIDDKGFLVDYNHAAKAILPWLAQSLIGKDVSHLSGAARIYEANEEQFEIQFNDYDSTQYIEIRKTPLREHNHLLGYVYFLHDNTKQKETLQALNYMASYDALTDLYNRRKLMDLCDKILEKAKHSGQSIGAIMLDVDHFKRINDEFGHMAGDEVLRQIARHCKEVIGDLGMVGRYGGEEFLILLPTITEEQGLTLAEKLRSTIEAAQIEFQDKTLSATVSIGLVLLEKITKSYKLDYLINQADKELYKAKAKGRNRVSY